jgi:phosphoribosylglycinamide formyltransferase-1
VHRVTAELDHGEILGQAVAPVLPGDTPEQLAARAEPGLAVPRRWWGVLAACPEGADRVRPRLRRER